MTNITSKVKTIPLRKNQKTRGRNKGRYQKSVLLKERRTENEDKVNKIYGDEG